MKTPEVDVANPLNASTAFKHFGPLQRQKMGAGPRLASTLLVGSIFSLLILFSLAHAREIKERIEKATLIDPTIVPEEPPPPPPPHLTPPPPEINQAPPKIQLPHDQPAPVIQPPEIKMNIPVPVVPAAPPRQVTPPPAPKLVALNVAPASVPNHYNAPSAVALGDPHGFRPSPNSRPTPGSVSLGLPGMPARNNGAGAAGARSISLGSGSPNGSPGGTDHGHAVSGVRLGVPNGQGTGPMRSTSAVAIAAPAPQISAPRVVSAAPTTPVTVLFTPHPAYTSAATANKVTGTVDVEVVFRANGTVLVIGVIRGLGYGLDQNALAAAASIRFHPAMQAGRPVDQHSIVHIQFNMIS